MMKYFLIIALTFITQIKVYSQKIQATVNSGAHVIQATDWSKFAYGAISIENLDGSNRHYYTTEPRPFNPNAMYVQGLDADFAQGTPVLVYLVKPLYKVLSAPIVSATVNSGAHVIKATDWLPFASAKILIEELDGRNQHIYTATAPRPTNPNAMYVEGIDADFAQGTSVNVYNLDEALSAESGNLGIAELSPAYKLDVNGVVHSKVNRGFSSRDGNYEGRWVFGSDEGDFQISEAGVNNWLRIKRTNGFVGIGTFYPTEKLAVNGKIRAKEIKVESANWPDYVFEEDYQPASLQETEDFIKTHKHLPEMPSEAEVKAEGISLGEMNAKLLKKIEELTLYVIEQEKTIQEQGHQLQRLYKTLDDQSKRIDKLEKY